MTSNVIKTTLTKSTKGTHVYGNSEPDVAVTSLYIKKATLSNPPPQAITVTIESEG